MFEVEFIADGSRCTTGLFVADPDKYEGQVICIECRKKAWFTKAYKVKDYERTACFNAHHEEGCLKATTILEAENMEDVEQDENGDASSADIIVNLDKTKHGSIEKSTDSDKTTAPPHNWDPSPKPHVIGGKSGFPMDRSLRQILSYLVRNPLYGERKSIHIQAESGRTVLEGMLRDYIVDVPDIKKDDYMTIRIFWGEINNYTEKPNGDLWLNYGTKSEPSIFLDKDLKLDVMDKYRMKDLSRFHGSHFIVVGNVFKSKNGKPVIQASYPKYMNFINYKEKEMKSS